MKSGPPIIECYVIVLCPHMTFFFFFFFGGGGGGRFMFLDMVFSLLHKLSV